jgi:hypothetical protein
MTRATTIANSTYKAMLHSLQVAVGGVDHCVDSGAITLSEKNTNPANRPKTPTMRRTMNMI